MTMRNRGPRVPRLEKVFTTTEVAMTLAAGNTGQNSQQATNQVTADFEAITGRQAFNITPMRQWVTGLWFTLAVVTTPVVIGLTMGMGIFSAQIDVTDFPNLSTHRGDYFLHRTWRLTDRFAQTTDPTPLDPSEPGVNSGSIAIDNKTSRKLRRTDQEIFIVIEKDVVTEENIQLHVDVTVMWGIA